MELVRKMSNDICYKEEVVSFTNNNKVYTLYQCSYCDLYFLEFPDCKKEYKMVKQNEQ